MCKKRNHMKIMLIWKHTLIRRILYSQAICIFVPAASVGWDDGYGEGHEVDEEAGHHGGRGVDGGPGALCHSVGEEDLEDDGEPDDGVEDGGYGGEEVDVVVKPQPRPD